MIFSILLCIYPNAKNVLAWHAYEKNLSLLDLSRTSIDIHSSNTKESLEKLPESMKVWSDISQSINNHNNNVLHGFRKAFNMIYKNQHPQNCSEAKFLIPPQRSTCGFGCEIHMDGVALAVAMKSGRVLLDATDRITSWETNTTFCKTRNVLGKECYYEPWSSCTLEDAGLNSSQVDSVGAAYEKDIKNRKSEIKILKLSRTQMSNYIHSKHRGRLPAMNSVRTLVIPNVVPFKELIPEPMKDILRNGPMKRRFWYYWWRAVSAAYIMRPNSRTKTWLTSHSTLSLKTNESCVAVYVRRGDKFKEMKLVPFPQYAATAEKMWDEGLVPGSQGQQTRIMFFSSEDPSVLQEAQEWAMRKGWKLLHVDIIDRNKSPARLKGPRTTGLENEYLALILNLQYALRCNAWVCTLASNFCRLIDELRATVGGQAYAPYADLSVETCSSSPCIGSGIKSFDW